MRYRPPYTVPEILQLRSDGKSNSQIAQRFGISPTRVYQVIAQEQRNAARAQRSAVIRREMAACNDVGRRLAVDDLFCVLSLPPRAETVLRQHFTRQGVTEFSLRDLMDFLIPEVHGPADHYDHMPAYRVKGLGQILYAALIKGLSDVDCGEALRSEWEERKTGLRMYLISIGGHFPYILNGKNPALRGRDRCACDCRLSDRDGPLRFSLR